MDRVAFVALFNETIAAICLDAEKALGRELSPDVIIRMYGGGRSGVDVSPEEFLDRAYINIELFID